MHVREDAVAERFVLARRVAREAGALLRARLGSRMHAHAKDVRSNLVTEADTQSEALIRDLVRASFPDDVIVGEEGGPSGTDFGHRWLVDPLDGTVNYTHGYRCFCVSIALQCEGRLAFGVVYDPMADEEYAAQRGGGATCNGQPVRVSPVEKLEDALLVTGFPPYRPDDPNDNTKAFLAFFPRAQALRRDGSAALDLCYVAAGRLDGFWEPGLHAWDVAAGIVIVTEAGGRVTGYRGEEVRVDGGRIVASNGRIHDAMLAVLAGCG
jgi:myo-inositol-1(or 4)-monophosphatase